MSLEARDITYAYLPGKPVLKGVSLELRRNELLSLLGPNGSGKTTLLECMCGLRRPSGGTVILRGRGLHGMPPRERALHVAYVPQIHRPVFGYTVLEVVLMGRAPYVGAFSAPGKRDREAALEALGMVGLSGLAERPYTDISGGEMRLVLIARALAQGAEFVLLDEPDAHLDPAHQHRVLSLAAELSRQGKGILVTTHNPNNALIYSDTVVLLREGRVISRGNPGEALTPERLREAYGIEFVLLAGEDGHRALVPAQGSPGSSPTGSPRGSGSRYSRESSSSFLEARKGR